MTFPHAMLRQLKANWDSYGAPPIDELCIAKAFEIWRQLCGEWQVVPCSDGGVQLEQHRDGFDIEITVSRAEVEKSAAPVCNCWSALGSHAATCPMSRAATETSACKTCGGTRQVPCNWTSDGKNACPDCTDFR